MAKKLTYGTLKSLDSKTFTQRKIEVNGYDIYVDEKFRPTTIQRLMLELIEKVQYMKENNLTMNLINYFPILLIKYFTSIEVPDDFERQIGMLELLVDNGFLEPIINAFDPDEIKKINELMQKSSENMNQLLDNPELLNTLLNGVIDNGVASTAVNGNSEEIITDNGNSNEGEYNA